MTRKEFIKEWGKAKKFHYNGSFQESIEVYNILVPIIENIESVMPKDKDTSSEYYKQQILFEKAMFWGDFSAPLGDDGHFELALEASKKALFYKEKGNFNTLLYIYFNTANIYLFSKNYEGALIWYDKALFENNTNSIWLNEKDKADYYLNKAEALYFLKRYEEAEKWFTESIDAVQNNQDFEPFYFLSLLNKLKGDEKQSQKFHKMFLTRKNKLSEKAFLQRIRFYDQTVF
jgi:tetratricopeptide (TPR) repeat protein